MTETAAGIARGFCELALQAPNPEGLADFYCEVFGFPVLSREDDRVWLACGERTRLGLWSPGSKEFGDRGGRHVHFAFSTPSENLDRLVERLRDLAVDFEGPVEHEGGDRSVYFKDPEGNVVEAWDFFEDGEGAREGVDALR